MALNKKFKSGVRVKQHDIKDCGAACLASIGNHFKVNLPIAKIRQFANTDKRGTNVLGMIEAAEKMGFSAKGVKGGMDALPEIPLPAIAHVIVKEQLHHYVVIYKVTKSEIQVMDFSTIASADRILVFEDGKIIEDGHHQQLLNLKGKYAGLWSKQTL